ncbi:MAG: hypothetical protein WCX32_01520 [Clostridia bacterium]|jgi:large-conductance mechanosensitive channel|nr:hypothetical protein [Clostridia bacterium]MDD4275598.1 hypothetical protein [Clostridia bacterium]
MWGDILSITAYVVLIAVTVFAIIYLINGFTKMYRRKKTEIKPEAKQEIKVEKAEKIEKK